MNSTKASQDKPIVICNECGSSEIQCTAWVLVNGSEVIPDDGPTDQIWCPQCEAECSTLDDCGFGFDLYREGEMSGHYETFAEALAEAKQSERPYDIESLQRPVPSETAGNLLVRI